MRAMAMLGVFVSLTAAGLPTSRAAETVTDSGIQQHTQSQAFVRGCVPWDGAASRAIAQWAQASPDVDVRLVSEAIAGLRRARRLCELGSLADACVEYDAVIRGVQRRLQAGAMPPMCRSVTVGVPGS